MDTHSPILFLFYQVLQFLWIVNAILVSSESMDLPALHGSVVHKLAARNKGNGHLYTIDWYGLDGLDM